MSGLRPPAQVFLVYGPWFWQIDGVFRTNTEDPGFGSVFFHAADTLGRTWRTGHFV